ncbi:cartilage intermediate layer protein 2-like [Platichthys flesus]|uniref:cartilage intermediate layer protein 2-like n=1 Tax=Platichthys flesus TaxID=8260 RepID=UPI002DBD87F4|nr:cartilage intermediate layer protein 2-like [Platichthys flesus]
MIKLLCVAIVAGLVLESNQRTLEAKQLEPKFPCDYATHIQCWTDWFDRDDPSGTGDWEVFSLLRIENPGKICLKPIQIEAKTLTGLSADAAGDVIFKSDTASGFVCRNKDQKITKMCNDYHIRFSCHPPFCTSGHPEGAQFLVPPSEWRPRLPPISPEGKTGPGRRRVLDQLVRPGPALWYRGLGAFE